MTRTPTSGLAPAKGSPKATPFAIEQCDLLRRRLISTGRARYLPELSLQCLVEYCTDGTPCGSFLAAVLSNDLKEACRRTDHINSPKLFDWVWLLHNHAPAGCWGSPSAYDAWVRQRGLRAVLSDSSLCSPKT